MLITFLSFRPINAREKEIKSHIAVEISGNREVLVKQQHFESKHSKKFTFDRAFGPNSTQVCLSLICEKSLLMS